MSTRLVILGLLRRRPLYGYELKQIIEQDMGDWTSIAFGSIYFALKKMAEEGLVEKVATEQEGNRPSRSVYRITPAGEIAFTRLLREVWHTLEREFYDIDLGIAFLEALPQAEIVAALRQRVHQLTGILDHLDAHQHEQMSNPEVPAAARAIFAHSRSHMRAELAWTQELLGQVERGELH